MTQDKLKWLARFWGAPALAGILGGSAVAQQQSHSDAGQLEEIIVTAEKRESTVQTTPISLTAVTGADIRDRGLADLDNLVQSVPGVSIRTSGPGMGEFEMRGIASTGGNSPTVGFYYDDVSLTAPSASNEGKIVISPALYDLNRVEVLRGPQGTLYGSGSMGGTIKVVPNAPNLDAFDASAQATFGDTDHGGFDHAENAMVNLPFGGGLAAVRIVGSYSRDAGWIDRVVIAPGEFPPANPATRGNILAAPVATEYHDVNDVERTTVRVSALIKPVEGLSITPSFFYQKLAAGGLPYIDSDPGTDAHYQPVDVSEDYRDEFKLGALTVKYTTPVLEVSSTTSYWSRNEPLNQDTTESWTVGLVSSGGPAGYTAAQGGIGAASAIEYNPTHQTTEELRVASVGDANPKWLVGYYYEDFHSAWNIAFPSQNGAAIYGSNNLFSYFSPMPIYQQSVFGEVTYNVTDPFAITVGLRRYHYNAPVSIDQYRFAHGDGCDLDVGEGPGGHTQGLALLRCFQGLHAVRNRLEGLSSGRRHRPGADLGTADLRSPAAARVRQHVVRTGTDLVQVGQRVELRVGREAALGRQSRDHQRLRVFREMERCSADQRALLLRLRLHGQRGQRTRPRRRARDPGHRGARPHGVGERLLLACGNGEHHSDRRGVRPGDADPASAAVDLVRVDRLPAHLDGSARVHGSRRHHLCGQPDRRDLRRQRAAFVRFDQHSRRDRWWAMVCRPIREQRCGQAGAAQQHHAGCGESTHLQPSRREPAAHGGHRPQLSVREVAAAETRSRPV